MDIQRDSTTDAVGFCLLPSELIQYILLYLALPEIIPLKLLNKSIANIISDQDFIRQCNSRSRSATWLFVYKRRWRRDTTLHGFTDQSDRWFKIPIADMLKPIIYPGEDLYFLTASANIFLFASNTRQVVIAVNLASKTVKRIPPSPLGPRGTSSWRRSGMKLVAGSPVSGHFRFLFAEFVENRPVLFEYSSETDKWQSMEAKEINVDQKKIDYTFLNLINGPTESVVIAVAPQSNEPVFLRPRFDGGGHEGDELAIGFSRGNVTDQLHVYGDGYMMIIRSDGVDHGNNTLVRMIKGIQVWGLSMNGGNWEHISKVPSEVIKEIKKPYGVMMGCLEERDGIIRSVLMSNFEGLWNIIWLCYDRGRSNWSWIPVPDCKKKGLNMAGITFSSGLTFS